MELFLQGLGRVFDPLAFGLMVFGVGAGIVIGAMPGMTASMGIILLLPITYYLEPSTALVMLAAQYCGAMYGGSISAILLNTPGTPSASATAIDGFQLTQQGRAGKALSMAILGSFVGGLVSALCLLLIAPQLAKIALKFQAADYFSLSLFGLTIMASASGKHILKGLIAGWMGLLISTVGIDGIVGVDRFTFGHPDLMRGFPLLPVLIGVFAFSQVFAEVDTLTPQGEVVKQDLRGVLPTLPEIRLVSKAILIGASIGVVIGIIPGTGGAIACFLAYNEARRWSRHKAEFGRGALEGVAAPEAANNATTGGALIPMLTLAVPGDVVTAVMLGALMLIGVRPGPLLFVERPEVVYTLLAGMVVIQFVMLIMGLGCTRFSPKVLEIPYPILMPAVILFCVVGAYTLANSLFDVLIALIFGVLGYFMRKLHYAGAPLVLGIILGPMAEDNLNRALLTSGNDWMVLVQRPISLGFLILSVVSIAFAVWATREEKPRTA